MNETIVNALYVFGGVGAVAYIAVKVIELFRKKPAGSDLPKGKSDK